ncbi:MAG: response regulator transcription factor [Methylocystis sp.]|nr:response regulator transcription factor [Methylocystis sp.]
MTARAATARFDPGASGAHILVVDDDKRIRTLLSRFLASEGYLVTSAANAGEAMARLRDLTFDLIVLDVMMPGESGTEFAARLRRQDEPLRSAPILMLTALTQPKDRVEGLEAGVDDYLAKPFEPRELSLRIASVLRRASRSMQPPAACEIVRFGDFSFHLERGELLERGAAVHLTTREREMLRVLARSGGDIVSRQRLARRDVDGGHASAGERSVDVEVARLRRKIKSDAGCQRYLQTIRGRGYRLLLDRAPSSEQGNGFPR